MVRRWLTGKVPFRGRKLLSDNDSRGRIATAEGKSHLANFTIAFEMSKQRNAKIDFAFTRRRLPGICTLICPEMSCIVGCFHARFS
jgi:hypothetical protein